MDSSLDSSIAARAKKKKLVATCSLGYLQIDLCLGTVGVLGDWKCALEKKKKLCVEGNSGVKCDVGINTKIRP